MKQTMKHHILVVDDDSDMREVLADALSESGYQPTTVEDGKAMWDVLHSQKCDLLIMDLHLQKESGLELVREVRNKNTLPIMMLTGKGNETDRIMGLEVAADDFLMKPFNVRELLARVHALLRRSTELSQTFREPIQKDHECFLFGDWILDLTSRELKNISGNFVGLTFGEFNLLETLARSPDRVLSREQLLARTRNMENDDVFDRTIDVLILRLRRKIEPNPKRPKYIRTERGLGYIFSGPVRAS